jgi:hypothetical protein
MESPSGEMAPPISMAGDPVALLASPQMAHPANAPLRAQATKGLQRQRGNFYVQQVMKHIQAEKGSGRPLEPQVRAEMESAFGQDFGDVRVHTDTTADRLAKELRARAFTTGQDVFIRSGESSPRSSEGKRLLGHELAHVVQQQGAMIRSYICRAGDALEREAELAGWAVTKGAPITIQTPSSTPLIQRQRRIEFTEEEVEAIEVPVTREAGMITAGELTEEQIKSAIKYNKARGYSVETIKIIQRTVGTKDDGIIGPNTVQAIARWQVQKGLVPDGKVGPKTLAKIYEEIPTVTRIEFAEEEVEVITARPPKATLLYFRDWKTTGDGMRFYHVLRPELEAMGFRFQPQALLKGEIYWKNVDEDFLNSAKVEVNNVAFYTIPPKEMKQAGFESKRYAARDMVWYCRELLKEVERFRKEKKYLRMLLQRAEIWLFLIGKAPTTVCCIHKLLTGALHNDELDDYLTVGEVRRYCGEEPSKKTNIRPSHYTKAAYEALRDAKSIWEFAYRLMAVSDQIRKAYNELTRYYEHRHIECYEKRAKELATYFYNRAKNKNHILSCYIDISRLF